MSVSFDEFGPAIIAQLSLKKTSINEYHGACPNCGGKDRFWITNQNGFLKHHCRQCDFKPRDDLMQAEGLIPKFEPRPEVDFPPSNYAEKKGLPLLGARLDGNTLVIDLTDLTTGEVVGDQSIDPYGHKRFSKGLRKHCVGAEIGAPTDTIYVCEGWADAVALNVSTGMQCVFALDANSLPATAKHIASLGKHVIVAADNDEAGIKAAEQSALPYVLPNQCKDFWELWANQGAPAVLDCLNVVKPALSNDPLDGFAITTIGGLLQKQFKDTVWLVPDLLPTPNLAMVAGPPKVGKSWYVGLLAITIARSGHEVIYIANEDTEKRLQTRFRSLDTDKGIHFISGLDSKKPLPKGAAAHDFIRALKKRYPNAACVVVDTLAAIRAAPPLRTKKDDYALAEEEFGALRKLAHELDLAIIAVHHTRKASDHDGSPVERLLGSQGIAATVETIMVMRQKGGSLNVDLHVTGKDVEQRDLIMRWKSPGFEWPEEMAEAELGSFQRKCLDLIRQFPCCTQKFIETELEADKSQVSKAVARLVEKRLVQRDEEGRLHDVIK